MPRTALSRRLADAYGIAAPAELIPPGFYVLVYLGGATLALDRYLFSGEHAARMGTVNLGGLGEIDVENDSAILVSRDAAEIVGAMTPVVSGRHVETFDDGFSANNLHGVWSWDWKGGSGVHSYVEEYTGDLYFRPQLQQASGWLHWHALLDRPSGIANDIVVGRRARLDLSSQLEGGRAITGEDVENIPFALGHCWISADHYRYRHQAQVTGAPTVLVSRWPTSGGFGGILSDSDPGWGLAQGCADPAGGDFTLGARSDLASPALHRVTAATSIADAWSDVVPATAVRALAAAVDVAGGVAVGYVLDDGSVTVFHGDPAAGAATKVRNLIPPSGIPIAIGYEP